MQASLHQKLDIGMVGMHEGWKLADRLQYSNVCNCTELYYSLLVPTCLGAKEIVVE